MSKRKISDCTFYHLSMSAQKGINLQVMHGSVFLGVNGRDAFFSVDGKARMWCCKPEEGVVMQNGVWFKEPNLVKAKELLIEELNKRIGKCVERINSYNRYIITILDYQEEA